MEIMFCFEQSAMLLDFQKVFKRSSKKSHIAANVAKSVSIKESLPLKMHICLCIYICMYVYVVLKVNSFLANLCSWTPRKCNMSLQQIPSMMQQCLGRWTYYFSKVCHQFIQHVFQKTYSMKLRKVII